ncbi:hypothetical protein SUGI_0065680 [Cryptomeria japonica]|nr:hypothetical protein SUGI_0065680 [Cryptomeria japonica]
MIINLMEEDEDDDECCEMKMEVEGQMPNIDEADMDNLLAMTDYVRDIYRFYHEREVSFCSSSLHRIPYIACIIGEINPQYIAIQYYGSNSLPLREEVP